MEGIVPNGPEHLFAGGQSLYERHTEHDGSARESALGSLKKWRDVVMVTLKVDLFSGKGDAHG